MWYCNYAEGSAAFADLMTDQQGTKHHITLPVGKMHGDVWLRQQKHAQEVLPPQFAEVVTKTKTPFVQSITDVLSPEASFFDHKLLLLGDALAGFRPHTAASTNQAAFDALQLADVFHGKSDWVEYERRVLEYARVVSQQGIAMGHRSQFEHQKR